MSAMYLDSTVHLNVHAKTSDNDTIFFIIIILLTHYYMKISSAFIYQLDQISNISD